jgi:hypothetical protein
VRSEPDAFEILWSIVESREAGDLCELKKVVLVRSMEMCRYKHNGSDGDRRYSGVGWFDVGDCSVSLSLSLCLAKVDTSLSVAPIGTC